MLSLALLISLPLALAAIGSGPGPFQNSVFWEGQNNHPNATGSVSLVSVNMTADPYNALSTELWTASINVTSVHNAPETNATLAITNSVISFESHGAFVENSLWDTCLVVMTAGVTRNATVKGQVDSGDCTVTFGTNCTMDWQNAVASARVAAGVQGNKTDACGGMTLPHIPESCKGSFELNTISSSILRANMTIGNAFYYQQDEPHDYANVTYYELAATKIWPILLIQTPGQRFANSSRSTGGFTSSRMSCLRAKNATTGSVPIGDVPGAGARVGFGTWGAVVVVAAVFAMI